MTDAPKLSAQQIAALSDRLKDRVEDLANKLLPGGTRRGELYRAARREAGGLGDGLTVYVAGRKKGKWQHFGGDLDGETFGDMLDLIRLTQRCSKEDARAWAMRYLGLEPGAVEFRRSPAEEALARQHAAESKRAEMERIARVRKSAKKLWLTCKPVTMDDPGGLYLAGRVPAFDKLLRLGWGMNALRFHPAMRHPEAGDVRTFPAILALCQFPSGDVATVHRLYLVEHKPGQWDVLRLKREGLEGKMYMCDPAGGFCPVWRGSREGTDRAGNRTGEVLEGWPWSDERAGPRVIVCEGIEDALSLASVKEDLRYAAALDLSNFGRIQLPEWARHVTWYADNDVNAAGEENKQAARQLDRALDRLEQQRREVVIARPPQGFKDANAALRGIASDAEAGGRALSSEAREPAQQERGGEASHE